MMNITDQNFLACLPFTLAQECPLPHDWSNRRNFSNDAGDSGGATMCGITHREYDTFRIRNHLPTRPVIQLEQGEGYEIYFENFWLPYCPKLKPGLQLSFFDGAVNEGITESVKQLQWALGIGNDGEWGPVTQGAVDSLVAPQAVEITIRKYASRRQQVYRMMRAFKDFGEDWIRRSIEIENQSLNMVQQ